MATPRLLRLTARAMLRPSKMSTQSRLHLLAQQLHRAHNPLVRDQAAGVEFGEDAGKSELIPQAREVVGDDLRCADDRPAAPRFVPGQRLQALGALYSPLRVEDAGAIGGFFEPGAEIAVKVHQAFLRIGEGLV